MLEIRDLHVSHADTPILKGVSLTVPNGEVCALMGQNGSGKSTLASVIMGHPAYTVTSGDILFNGNSILSLSPTERSHLGLFLVFQHPREIEGVHTEGYLHTISNAQVLEREGVTLKEARKNKELRSQVSLRTFKKELSPQLDATHIPQSFLARELNRGLSGGEKKRLELLQMSILKPQLTILDELDSGVDVDALEKLCESINEIRSKNTMGLIVITHYPRILEYLSPDAVHIMEDGSISRSGDIQLAYEIEKSGFTKKRVTI